MNKRKFDTAFLVQAAVIAAIYAALTLFAAPISFGAQQFRISEALTVLPVLTPAAIPGLAVGCVITNLGSPYGIIDIICGASATFLAALCTRASRNIRFRKLPVLSLIFPVIFNGIIVGLEISFFLPDGISFFGFAASAAGVAFGELVSCYALGLPLYAALSKTRIFR